MSERDARVEEIAAELHEQYLATARRLRWTLKPNVNAPYPKLSEDAKELDRVFARWHLAHIDRLTAETERLRALAYIGECQFDDLTWKSRCDELVTDLRSAEARVAALEAALRWLLDYAVNWQQQAHHSEVCDCGLCNGITAARATLTEPALPQGEPR